MTRNLTQADEGETAQKQASPLFENPFHIEDLLAFDDDALRRLLVDNAFGVTFEELATSLHDASPHLVRRILQSLNYRQRRKLRHALRSPLHEQDVQMARHHVLDNLFWELTYWKTPELYEELTEGEQLHPGIFQQLEPDIRGKTILDVGAGSGRATLECLRAGAALVHAVEPSPGLLRLLSKKCAYQPVNQRVQTHIGRFDAIPLPDASVDIALSCSAFTASAEQGGEPGLREMKRVTRPGGKIIIIWPRVEDREWLQAHGFYYVSLPVQQEMRVHFRSLQAARECARRFYAHNRDVLRYILTRKRADIPFSVIGVNPPCDYCWADV